MLRAFVFICVVVMVKSENYRGKREHYGHRQPKLFSFNVLDEDVTIDLQFAIPFLKIPVKKTMDSAYGIIGLPTININPASLALGGAVVLGTTVILPFFAKQYAHNQENFRYAKLVGSEETRRRFGEQQVKLFSFNVMDEDIKVEMDFKIPFLKIPAKKKMDFSSGMMELPTININPASLAFGGIVVLGSTVVLPYLIKRYTRNQESFQFAKLIDNAEFGADSLLDLGQQVLMSSNGFGGCPLRLACWAAQKDIGDPRAILSQIINNKLLSAMVNSSAVEDAMISGLHGRSCSSYSPCPLQEHHVPMLINNLSMLTNAPDNY